MFKPCPLQKHRVMMPVTAKTGRCHRRSIVCFVHPDANCMIECIDASNKYPPITAEDYIKQRFSETLLNGNSSTEED